jgi:hypothetical protein
MADPRHPRLGFLVLPMTAMSAIPRDPGDG